MGCEFFLCQPAPYQRTHIVWYADAETDNAGQHPLHETAKR